MQNDMRDRLVELLKQIDFDFTEECSICFEDGYNDMPRLEEFFADHLIANGVIVPPCKVGDIVYAKYSKTNEIEYYVVGEVIHLGSDNFEFKAYLENEDGYIVDNIDFGVKEIGLTVFLAEEQAEQKLKELRAADVQEVKHGYWEDDEYMYICNICGRWLDITQGTADMNYCPNCGAKMDGDDK